MSDGLALGGADPIDARLGSAPPGQADGWSWHRPALGLAPSPVPSSAVLLAGLALGPQGLGVLTPDLLRSTEPAVAASAVVLGALIGLDAGTVRVGTGLRLAGGAAVEAAVTLLGVAAGFLALAHLDGMQWLAGAYLPWLLGISAASSATRIRRDGDTPYVARLGDLDDVLPIAAGAALLAVAVDGPGLRALTSLASSAGLAVVVAAAGWFLVSGASGESEQRVYAAGSVLLLTGVATAFSASPLLVGAIAAVAWSLTRATGREPLSRDFRYLQHPLVVFVWLIAGASAHLTEPVLFLAGAFVVARVAGKAIGGALAASLVPELSRRLGFHLLAPGTAGIVAALMLSGMPVAGTVEPLLGTVVCGAIASDLLARLWGQDRSEA